MIIVEGKVVSSMYNNVLQETPCPYCNTMLYFYSCSVEFCYKCKENVKHVTMLPLKVGARVEYYRKT